jgi:hypothetical protein
MQQTHEQFRLRSDDTQGNYQKRKSFMQIQSTTTSFNAGQSGFTPLAARTALHEGFASGGLGQTPTRQAYLRGTQEGVTSTLQALNANGGFDGIRSSPRIYSPGGGADAGGGSDSTGGSAGNCQGGNCSSGGSGSGSGGDGGQMLQQFMQMAMPLIGMLMGGLGGKA